MKAFVLQGKGDARLMERPVPSIHPGDALERTTAVAICTTDIHLIKTAAWPQAIGKVISHESV